MSGGLPFARRASVLLALSALAACTGEVAGGDPEAWDVSATALALDERDWNPNHAELMAIAAVGEDGDDVIVWSASGASVLAGGAVTASDASVTDWRFSARIPAPDGSGFWPVAVDSGGEIYRMRARTKLEDVSDRYGLLGMKVRTIAALAAPYVAFGLDKELALADGAEVKRYAVPAGLGLAAAPGTLAAIDGDGAVRVFDMQHHTAASVGLDGVRAAVYMDGRLLLETEQGVYEAKADGHLVQLYRARGALHGLALGGGRVWLGEDTRLCALDVTSLACSADETIAADATLEGSASGDVWVLAGGELARYGVAAQGDQAEWQTHVFSVYARVCSACHAPGGSAGVDLSSYAAWSERRAKVYEQVIVRKAMPPDRVLSDDDRSAIESWSAPK